MPVPQTSFPAFGYDYLLPVFGNFVKYFLGFGIPYHCTQRHFDIFIATVGSSTALLGTVAAVFGFYVSLKLEVKQRPKVFIAFNDYVSAATTVTPIGATFSDVFFTV